MINIAIDGPSSSGKSTIAKALAKHLGYVHIDTGSMYRSVAYACIQAGADLDSEEACLEVAKTLSIDLDTDGIVLINGRRVAEEIRTDAVSQGASKVSRHKGVRDYLVRIQQQIAKRKGFVLDGRDITSVVLPDAEIKIYQTADASVRAQRRYEELLALGFEVDYNSLYDELVARDERDMNRKESPLIKVADAIEIDTTYLSVDEIVNLILEHIESR